MTASVHLQEDEWQGRRAAHTREADAILLPHLQRAQRGEKHAVMDFLFTYYAFRPSWLRRWHPGIGTTLFGSTAREFLRWPGYAEVAGGIAVAPSRLPPQRLESVRWISQMLRLTEARPPFYGCHGLHEWAMVFGCEAESIRHAGIPLRLPQSDIDQMVRKQGVRCSHFDAFRHFSPEALPLNRIQLTRADVPLHEQPGCLHANMDLYKWAFKLAPFTPSELVLEAFRLAVAIREVDMRASPYDLRSLGYEPICIETGEGRLEYERLQRSFVEAAQPLRQRLIAVCDAILISRFTQQAGGAQPESQLTGC